MTIKFHGGPLDGETRELPDEFWSAHSRVRVVVPTGHTCDIRCINSPSRLAEYEPCYVTFRDFENVRFCGWAY